MSQDLYESIEVDLHLVQFIVTHLLFIEEIKVLRSQRFYFVFYFDAFRMIIFLFQNRYLSSFILI